MCKPLLFPLNSYLEHIWWWMLNRHTNGRPVLVDGMSRICGPWMDSESDCDEDDSEDTLNYFQESGEEDRVDLEETSKTLTTSESEVNSIRFFNNPNYQSNQMRE
jgi:hypothetical protein